MAYAKGKGTIGQGWHLQSSRHSRAKKFGNAGGRYAHIGKDLVQRDKTPPTKEKVYTFKGKSRGVKYNVPHVTLKDAQIRARHKWGEDVILSSGRLNSKLTRLRYKTRWE